MAQGQKLLILCFWNHCLLIDKMIKWNKNISDWLDGLLDIEVNQLLKNKQFKTRNLILKMIVAKACKKILCTRIQPKLYHF